MDDADLAETRIENEIAGLMAQATEQLQGTGTLQCVECGEEIGAERRQALPSARRCVDCQHAEEVEKKARGG